MGFGLVQAERAAIEMTYEDTAVILRPAAQTGGDHFTRQTLQPVGGALSCALSYGTDNSTQSDDQHTVDYTAGLFVAPERDILPGDFVDVVRFGKTLSFEVIGRPVVYATHQEVRLKDRDLA